MTSLADHDHRRDALLDFQRNLVVTAGAGTGKTSLLVGRLVSAMLRQHLEPQNILAVTFTENAAGEMRERLVTMLRAVPRWLDGESLPDNIQYVLDQLDLMPANRDRAAELASEADQLRIDTFHGFCLRFLREHARLLGLPPDLDILSNAARDERFEQAFVDYCREVTREEADPAFEHFSPKQLLAMGYQLLELPEDSWQRIMDPFVPLDLDERQRDLQQMRDEFAGAQPNWQSAAADYGRCYQLLTQGETFESAWLEKDPTGGVALGKERAREAKHRLRDHRDYLLAFVRGADRELHLAVEFLRPLLQRFRRQALQRGEVTFQDLLVFTRQYLMQDSRLRESVARRLSCVLVDEFQDTDPLQYDVLFLLAAQPVPGQVEAPMSLQLRPGTICIVGDAKQSIYRFRRADIAAFSRAVTRILDQDGKQLELTSNFRSLPPILEFVNEVCSQTILEQPPYQFSYQDVQPSLTGGDSTAVELLRVDSDDRCTAAQRRHREGHLCVAAIQRLHAEGTEYRDIAILLRAAAETSWLMRPLRESGIPYVLEGSRRFYRRQEVILATALINAMAWPHDPVPILALLRSGFSGASDAEVLAHLSDGHSLDFRHLKDDGEGKTGPVTRCLQVLHELHEDVSELPVDRALTRIMDLDHLRLMEASGYEGAQRLANLDRLTQLLLRQDLVDLQDAARFLARNARLETDDEESDLFGGGLDAVRVLTVHTAKGLEFGTVLFPDMARQWDVERPREARVERSFDADGHEAISVQLADRENTQALLMKAANRAHALAEHRRLFYVAATRARNKLILVHGGGARSGTWLDDLREVDPEGLTHRIGDGRPATGTGPEATWDPTRTHAALDAHLELVAKVATRLRPVELAPSRTKEVTDFEHLDRQAVAGSRVPAQELGAAMHDYLAAVDPQLESVDEVLLQRLPYVEELRPMAEAFHRSDMRARLASARNLHRELPLTFQETEGAPITNGFVDALLQEQDGVFCAVDWKTDRVAEGAHERAAEHYRAQLQAYGRGLRQALGLKQQVRLVVHFLRADRSVDVS